MERVEFGWVRETKRYSAKRQVEDLEAAGIPVPGGIESDWTYADLRMREDSTLVVCSLHLIAPDEETLRKRLAQAFERGALIRDLSTGATHDPRTITAGLDIKKAWQDEKHCKDRKEMSRRGALGGRPKLVPEGSPAERLIKSMVAMDKTNAEVREAVARIHGIVIKDAKTIAEVVLREEKPPAKRRPK